MWGVVGRSPSIESESLACSKPHIGHDAQGSDLVAIVLALQAQVGGLREEVGGLRERVKFLENKDNGDAFPPVDKMFEGGGLGGSPGDLELNVVTADREEGGKMESRGEGGPEDGSREGQASPWLTEELEQSYELQESMWDAVVYIGADKNQGGMGYAGSAYTVLLLVLNVAVQALFVVIVWGIVSEPQFDANSVEGFRSWRRNIAHSVNEMEELTQKSLASRVCTSDAGLETSQGQAAAYANIQSYLKMTTGLPAGDGFLMCMLALVMWYLSVGKEVTGAISLARGVWGLPGGKTTHLVPEGDEPHATRFESISPARRALVITVQVIRLVVSGVLMHAGTLFLAFTISLTELLLNAVALEFVLSVDELLFQALAPVKLCLLISGAAPLPLPPVRAWKGLNWAAGALLIAIVALLAAMLPIYVTPQMELLNDARDALCGGETAFVYAMGGSGLPAWGASNVGHDTSPLTDWRESTQEEDAALTYVGKAVEAAIGGYGTYKYPEGKPCGKDGSYPFDGITSNGRCTDPGGCVLPFCSTEEANVPGEGQKCCIARQLKAPKITEGRFSVQASSRQDVGQANEVENPTCRNMLDEAGSHANLQAGALADAIGSDCPPDASIGFPGGKCPAHIAHCDVPSGKCVFPSCGDAQPHCYNDTAAGTRARQFCPTHCGCDDLTSPLVLIAPDFGCPMGCSRSANYKAKMASLPCVDAAAGSAEMNLYADGLFEVGGTWPYNWKEGIVNFVVPSLRAGGCAMLPMMTAVYLQIDLCIEKGTFWPIKPIRYLCPVTCGCKKGMDQCPDSCPLPSVNDTFLVRDV